MKRKSPFILVARDGAESLPLAKLSVRRARAERVGRDLAKYYPGVRTEIVRADSLAAEGG